MDSKCKKGSSEDRGFEGSERVKRKYRFSEIACQELFTWCDILSMLQNHLPSHLYGLQVSVFKGIEIEQKINLQD